MKPVNKYWVAQEPLGKSLFGGLYIAGDSIEDAALKFLQFVEEEFVPVHISVTKVASDGYSLLKDTQVFFNVGIIYSLQQVNPEAFLD